MLLSLKRQRKDENARLTRDEDRKGAQKKAAEHLRTGAFTGTREIAHLTGAPKSAVVDIKRKMEDQDERGLRKLISPKRSEAQRVLKAEEDGMIVSHFLWAARRGFALEVDQVKSIMGRIANDGRGNNYMNGVPSDDAIRSFRARHPSPTYRKA